MNDSQLATLKTELAKPTYAEALAVGKYAEVAAALNARASAPNPTPQGTRPKLITWSAFMQALTDADGLKLYSYGSLAADMKAALAANDRTMAADLYRSLATVLTQTSKTAVQAAFQQTELDPTYQATVLQPSIATGLGLPVVAGEDVRTVARSWSGATK